MRLKLGNRKIWLGALGVLAGAWLLVALFMGGLPSVPPPLERTDVPVGYATVDATVSVMTAQLDSFSGWTPNDLPFSPTYLLDNLPNFQLGVLQVARHASRILKEDLTRQRTTTDIDADTDAAYSAYSNDPHRWAFPSAESAFSRGNEALTRFVGKLGDTGQFYPRADNLVRLLEQFASELGAVTTPLLEAGTDQISWFKIDDNFYRALGTGYAMLAIMRAVEKDFEGVLRDKNAAEITNLILASLAESQFSPWVVTNGARAGILANHSSNLKAYLDDARQKMNSLITILRQG